MHSIIPAGVSQNGGFDVVMGGMMGSAGEDLKGKGKERAGGGGGGTVEMLLGKAYNVSWDEACREFGEECRS